MNSVKLTFSTNFKAKVALAALKGDKTVTELEEEFAVPSDCILKWKQHLIKNISLVFEQKNVDCELSEVRLNHAKIGEIMAENDFLTKVLGR